MHGGKAPQVAAAIEQRRQEAAAVSAARSFGLPVDVSPQDALLEELRRTAGAVAWLGSIVAEAEKADLVEKSRVSGLSEMSVWVRTYQAERKHLVDVSKACVSAGIAERMVELEAEKVRLVAVAFGRALDAVGSSAEQRETAARVLMAELRGGTGDLERGGE